MLLRERQTAEGLLVSVCDAACLGETYEEGEVSLNVTEAFYGGDDAEAVGDDAVVESLARASVANIVGEASVAVAIDAGVVDETRVLSIEGTPHAQLVRM
ncbi:hypothetical protein GCM10008995_14340 [Halobellus salinus]|uniref:DUF424 domain-containing protein n=1 Tax=Halobellus salinus TaxID=931585 RepID=A0A830ENC2_9EURY|nr:DUF424 family protein [Halobellus salinus]GGJ05656.1 hypothetical protein GCM10008995_14340 [Halobellus salinus]SMP23707.1 hypothetical protein SAMN06265347_10981 [Halobellus salinus]